MWWLECKGGVSIRASEEKVGCEVVLVGRVDEVLVEVCVAQAAEVFQDVVVDEKVAGELLGILLDDEGGGVGHDLWLAGAGHDLVASEEVLDGGGGNGCSGPERVEGDLA